MIPSQRKALESGGNDKEGCLGAEPSPKDKPQERHIGLEAVIVPKEHVGQRWIDMLRD